MFHDTDLDVIEKCVAERYGAPRYACSPTSVQDYIDCCEAARRALPSNSELTPRGRAVAVVAAVMAPQGARLFTGPGLAQLDNLLTLASSLPEDPSIEMHELAIAFGTGWGRTVTGGAWLGPWHGAVMAYFEMIAQALRASRAASGAGAGRDLDHDAGMLLESLLRPHESIHQPSHPNTGTYALTVRAGLDPSVPSLELFDPVWSRDREMLPSSAVKSFHLESTEPLTVDGGSGGIRRFSAVSRVAIRAEPLKPRVDIVPTIDPVQHIPLHPGASLSLVVSNHDALQAWRCLCGSPVCRTWHRLDAWRPEEMRLSDFISRSIGTSVPGRGIRSMDEALCL